MEIEKFIRGYCRQLDASRMVEVIIEDKEISEIDCCYGNCEFQTNCIVAQQIEELKKA